MLNEILAFGRILSKTEQKSVTGGGVQSGSCAAIIPCTIPGRHDDTCGGGDLVFDVSKEEALSHVSNGGRWCCESCSSASWYPY